MTRTATRSELVRVGTEIIAQHGFNTTGLNAVLRSAGVPKGSFYYYFASKEEFGLAVIENFADEYATRLDSFLLNAKFTPLQRIRNYFKDGVASMNRCQCMHGCPIGNLSLELAGQNETFRARLDAVFRDWQKRFAQCFAEAAKVGEIAADSDAKQLAEFMLSGWEGAILRAKVMKSAAPMKAFVEVFFNRVLTQA
ncbi:MAG: TetR family transcriptional regulator C-terminal domain-containing protein [Gammaproteobacteria bacterium]|nr:TetR family transcriptional regulator C-terminal domain-containing protein [Gammaproteobacteria bacterium]